MILSDIQRDVMRTTLKTVDTLGVIDQQKTKTLFAVGLGKRATLPQPSKVHRFTYVIGKPSSGYRLKLAESQKFTAADVVANANAKNLFSSEDGALFEVKPAWIAGGYEVYWTPKLSR